MLACWLRNGLPRKTACRNQRVSENRRLVDVRGVMVLGVAGITEPVEIPSANLIFLPLCEPPEIREGSENPRRFTTYNWLVGVRAVDGREFNHEVAFRFNRKEAAEALAAQYGGSIPIIGMNWSRCPPRSGQTMK
jgi:hypothetical protein